MQQLHVAGIGRVAVEDFRCPGEPAHDLGQRRVFHVRELDAGLIGLQPWQEQVPQALRHGLALEVIQQSRGVFAFTRDPEPLGVGRQHVVVHEGQQLFLQRDYFFRVFEVHWRSLVWFYKMPSMV